MWRLLLPTLLALPAFGLRAQTTDSTTSWRSMVTGWRVNPATHQLGDTTPSVATTSPDGDGASVVLRSSNAGPTEVGSVSTSVPAHAFRGRQVRVSAELRTRAVCRSAPDRECAGGLPQGSFTRRIQSRRIARLRR